MSVKVRPFKLSDLFHLEVQKRHSAISPLLWRHFLLLGDMEGPFSWTVEIDGTPMAAYGTLGANNYAWALLANGLGHKMIAITRAIKLILASHARVIGPVYAHIDETHPEAVRWATILGFEPYEGITWRFS